MTWISGIAIGGMILAAGPIIIHILFRRRYKVVRFAAFQFLIESRKKTRQRTRIEELILIFLRVLACLLMGLMLADIRSTKATVGGSGMTAHVFVLDDSMSMGQQAGTENLYRKATSHILKRLDTLGAGDSVAVVSASRPGRADAMGKLMPLVEAKQNLAERLRSSRTTGLRVDMPAAMKAAASVISAAVNLPVRLYVCSDFRRPDFGPDQAEALRKAFAEFDPKLVEVTLLDFGLPCRNNLVLEQLIPTRSLVVAGVPTVMRALVRNAGSEPSAASRIEVSIGDAALPVQQVPPLSPRETATVEIPCTFGVAGSAYIKASLPPDDLPDDSSFPLALNVQESLRIVVIDGSQNPAEPQSPSFALVRALDPSGRGAYGRRVDVVPVDTWNPSSVSGYDVVILANIKELPSSQGADGAMVCPGVKALEDFVRIGGGLGIFVGEGINTAFYNGAMHADGKGLSPLQLSERPIPPPDPNKFVRLNPESVQDEPMIRIFSSRGMNFSQFLRFHAHVTAQPPAEGGSAKVLAAFDNGSPALCRRSYGKGTVIMWYSSADTKWSNWPKDLSFVPVVNDMAWELARTTENFFSDLVGRTIGYSLPARLSGALAATLKTPAYPAEDVHSLALQDKGGEQTVSHPFPSYAGIYELTLLLADRSEHRVLFSRHTDPRESDLARVQESDLKVAVNRPCKYVTDLAKGVEPVERTAPVISHWLIILAVLLAVLVIENVLALRFGHYRAQSPKPRDTAESPA
jgi:hypothetical protein